MPHTVVKAQEGTEQEKNVSMRFASEKFIHLCMYVLRAFACACSEPTIYPHICLWACVRALECMLACIGILNATLEYLYGSYMYVD